MLSILISNDDGVYAEGISTLTRHLEKIARVQVVAPDRNRSGASNSLTLNAPLRIHHLPNNHISVEGTPTDCVHIATTGLFEDTADLVVSGINHGANLGDDVWYSGTVAAAMEGRFLGLSAIAVSLVGATHFDTAAKVTVDLLKKIEAHPLSRNTILNVNIPDVPYDQLQGQQITRLGTRHGAEPTIKQLDPRGEPVYWIGPPGKEADNGEGTDFHAVANNAVSITPLRVDITDDIMANELLHWVE